MALPIKTSYAPMDALSVDTIPDGPDWQYEPKWDGFRCLAFRDGNKIDVQSKSGQPLGRYFPELLDALRELPPSKFVLDAEIVIPQGQSLSFDALLQRIHPSESRIRKLSAETPGVLVVFDLLVDADGKDLSGQTLDVRRHELERFAAKHFRANERVILSPAATDLKTAHKWFAGVGGALDGVIAKRTDMPYQSGNRTGMVKIKKLRTADCVVGGFRYASKGKSIGSLLLGLYGDDGLLHHVGFCSSFKTDERKKLSAMLEPLIQPPGFTGRSPGGPSRWSTERSTEWKPLAPKIVVEVRYDHFTGGRFRHGTAFLRWRPDKAPKQCTMAQVEQESASNPLKFLTGAAAGPSRRKSA
ncbi:MAG TPA: ATP-dependent DNA ligase [Tepidisphaeraceae bacterium]|nr:ATP-dependent DNA ligase [Tepidisphaeraceae bacterium]